MGSAHMDTDNGISHKQVLQIGEINGRRPPALTKMDGHVESRPGKSRTRYKSW